MKEQWKPSGKHWNRNWFTQEKTGKNLFSLWYRTAEFDTADLRLTGHDVRQQGDFKQSKLEKRMKV